MRNVKIAIPLIIGLLVINIVGTTILAVHVLKPAITAQGTTEGLAFNEVGNGQYILYIGHNPDISTDDAKEIVNGICATYVNGYTVLDAYGGWTNNDGVQEGCDTLVYIIIGATETEIESIMQEALAALEQDSILLERRDVSYVFYDGND